MRALLVSLLLACGCRTGLYALDDGEPLADAAIDSAVATDDGIEVVDDAASDVPEEAKPCIPGVLTLTKATPAVMLVLDRSGSMAGRLGTTKDGTRWEILTDALAAALPPVDASMSIGALLFPNATSPRGPATCNVNATADLVPKTGNVDKLLAIMRANTPMGGTPTAVAIDNAAKILEGVRAASTARALVLATDGAPGCNPGLDPRTCRCASTLTDCSRDANMCLDDARTLDRMKSWFAKGLPTYVIGIDVGEDDFSDVLDQMAVAGGHPLTSGAHKYYGARSSTELETAVVSIRNQVASCTFLTTSVPDAKGSIEVRIGGVVIPYDESGMTGWKWADEKNGEIVLAPDACAKAASTSDVSAQVGCSDI